MILMTWAWSESFVSSTPIGCTFTSVRRVKYRSVAGHEFLGSLLVARRFNPAGRRAPRGSKYSVDKRLEIRWTGGACASASLHARVTAARLHVCKQVLLIYRKWCFEPVDGHELYMRNRLFASARTKPFLLHALSCVCTCAWHQKCVIFRNYLYKYSHKLVFLGLHYWLLSDRLV